MNNQEFLEFMGTGLTSKDKEELKLSGYGTVYTSEVYKNKTKNMIRKVAPPYSVKIFESMIDRGLVIPISLSKNLFNYLKRRKEIKSEKNLGFYDFNDKKIYLLWEPIERAKRKNTLVTTLFHEVIHMAAADNPRAFFNINKAPLLKYYFYIYYKFFKVPKQHHRAVMNAVSKWVLDALVIRESKGEKNKAGKAIVDFINKFDKYSTLDQKEIDRKQQMVYDSWEGYTFEHKTYQDEEELWKYFDNAYLRMFKIDTKKLKLGEVAEEIDIPSSVICKLASYNPNLPYVKKSLRIIV